MIRVAHPFYDRKRNSVLWFQRFLGAFLFGNYILLETLWFVDATDISAAILMDFADEVSRLSLYGKVHHEKYTKYIWCFRSVVGLARDMWACGNEDPEIY